MCHALIFFYYDIVRMNDESFSPPPPPPPPPSRTNSVDSLDSDISDISDWEPRETAEINNIKIIIELYIAGDPNYPINLQGNTITHVLNKEINNLSNVNDLYYQLNDIIRYTQEIPTANYKQDTRKTNVLNTLNPILDLVDNYRTPSGGRRHKKSRKHTPSKYPKFEKNKWNKNKYTQKSHNCYAYALNVLNPTNNTKLCKKYMKKTKKKDCPGLRPQPGRYGGYLDEYYPSSYTCKKLEARIKKDNPRIRKLKKTQKLPKGYYKMALAVRNDNKSYHFYREDNNKLWSHKDGTNKAVNKDGSGRVIHDPKKANRGKYTKFCGYYKVPIKSKKHITSKTRRHKKHIGKFEKLY